MAEKKTSFAQGAVPDGAWRKFHKVTPVAQTGAFWIAIVGFGVYNLYDIIGDSFVDFVTGARGWVTWKSVFIGIGIFLGVSILITLWAMLVWHFQSYAIVDSGIHRRTGILIKNHEHMRWDRVQTVEIEQRLFGRIFGFGSVKVDSAGAGEQATELGLLRMDDCQALRREVLFKLDRARRGLPISDAPVTDVAVASADLVTAPTGVTGIGLNGAMGATGVDRVTATEATGADPAATTGATGVDPATATPATAIYDDSSDRCIYQLPTKRLLTSQLLSGGGIFLMIFIVACVVIGIWWREYLNDFSAPALVGIASGVLAVMKRAISTYKTQIYLSRNGLRMKQGLTTLKIRSLPPNRIHAVRVSQPLLWRRMDWWSVNITVAGAQSESLEDSIVTLMPAGTRAEVETLLWAIFPTLGSNDDHALVNELLYGKGPSSRLVTASERARILDLIQRTSRGFFASEHVFAIREGRFTRTVEIIMQDHTQSTAIKQGPLQRRAGVATLKLDLLPGAAQGTAHHFDVEVVQEWLVRETALAKRARELAVSETLEEWAARVGVDLDKPGG